MTHELRDLLARNGHLTMLSLDRYDTGELDASARRFVESHVETCDGCRARLRVVATHVPLVAPPRVVGRSTGSATIAYLAASAGVALAASAVLGLGSAMWPSPQAAREHAVEATHSASSYTSVAQEYSEAPELDVELAMRGDTLVVTPQGDGWLAVVAVRDEAQGDTDGDGESTVVAVLQPARATTEAVSIAIGRRISTQRVIALACPGPFTVELGEPLAAEPGCVAHERP